MPNMRKHSFVDTKWKAPGEQKIGQPVRDALNATEV